MKKDLDLKEGLSKFSGIVMSVLNTNIGSITGESPNMSLASAFTGDPSDIVSGYDKGVLISSTEGKSSAEAGLVFTTQDITMLADMMLMGDGDSKDSLDDDLKDAINEMMNQFFGGLTVPVNSELGQKVQFKVDGVSQLLAPHAFQANEFISFDLTGTVKGKALALRFYMDSSLGKLFGGEEKAEVIGTDFFGASEPASAPAASHTSNAHIDTSGNMGMLLDIDIPISVRMGTAKLFLKDILGLGPGNIVELDQNADEMVELTVNDQLIARGEVVIVDGYFGFRIKEIISKAERIKRLKD
jgi:flagellar motor switch protein FliN/FliY